MADTPQYDPALFNPLPAPPVGFDLGFGPGQPPEIAQPLNNAGSISSGLTQKIHDSIVNSVASASVTADVLNGKIAHGINATLAGAHGTLQQLQQPIAVGTLQQLGSAAEQAMRLGVVPPTPDNPTPQPASVTIRQAGLSGDITPALQVYNQTALPLALVGGLPYAQAVQQIKDALPRQDNVQSAFSSVVQGVQQSAALAATPGDPQVECLAKAAATLQQALANCAQYYDPTPGSNQDRYNYCIATANGQYQDSVAECNAMGSGGPTVPGVPPPPIPPIPPPPPLPPKGPPPFPPGPPQPPQPPPPPIFNPGQPIIPAPPTPSPQPPNAPQPPVTPGPVGTPPPPGEGLPGQPLPGGSSSSSGGPVFNPPPVPVPPGQPPGSPPPIVQPPPPQTSSSSSVSPNPNPPPPGSSSSSSSNGGGIPLCNSWQGLGGVTYSVQALAGIWNTLLNNYGDPFQALTQFTLQTGLQAGIVSASEGCMSNSVAIGPPITAGFAQDQQLCVPCQFGGSSSSSSGGSSSSGCCPVIVNVNCPTGTSPIPSPTPTPTPTPPGPAQPPIQAVNQPIEGCDEFGAAPGIPMPNGFGDLSKLIGIRNADGTLNSQLLSADNGPIAAAVGNTITGIIATGVDQIAKIAQSIISQSGCASGQQISLIASSVVLNFLRNWVGDSLDGMRVPNQQQRNYLCPTALPQSDEALADYYGNTINEATLECWVRACGIRYPEFSKSIQARRTKLSPQQVGMLNMRGYITDNDYPTRIRELGMINPGDPQEILNLLKLLPPASDLVRFMVRDTADEGLVQKFGMDDDFQLKYAGNVKKWAQQQGMTDEYMQSVWRAHWAIPAPTQLFDMLHRNSRLPAGDPAYVDLQTIRTALEQQDILPYWIDKLINIAYRPLTRVDAQRAYRNGTLTANDLLDSYLNLGYNQTDAQTLVDFNTKQIRLSFRKLPAVRDFAQGYLTFDEFKQLLIQAGADDAAWQDAYDFSLVLRDRDKRKRCVNALHKRMVKGDISADDATTALVDMGLDANLAGNLVSGWQCEVSSNGKALPAGELCGLYESGAIDVPELTKRLQNIGYSYDNSVLLARRCAGRVQAKITRAEQTELRQQEAQAIRDQNAQIRAVNRAATQTAKAQRQATSLQKARVMREKRLIEAGTHFAKEQSIALADAIVDVKSVYNGLINSSEWLPDEIIAAIITAAKDPTKRTLNEYVLLVQQILAS